MFALDADVSAPEATEHAANLTSGHATLAEGLVDVGSGLSRTGADLVLVEGIGSDGSTIL